MIAFPELSKLQTMPRLKVRAVTVSDLCLLASLLTYAICDVHKELGYECRIKVGSDWNLDLKITHLPEHEL